MSPSSLASAFPEAARRKALYRPYRPWLPTTGSVQMLFGSQLSLLFWQVGAGSLGPNENPSSLGTPDPHNPAWFLARVSSARGKRDSVLPVGRGRTLQREIPHGWGLGPKQSPGRTLWSPSYPENSHSHRAFLPSHCRQGPPAGGGLLPPAWQVVPAHFCRALFLSTCCKTASSLHRDVYVNVCCLSGRVWLLVMSLEDKQQVQLHCQPGCFRGRKV